MNRRERLRWRIADLVARIPGQCWAGLAEWALGSRYLSAERRVPWARQSAMCREGVARNGCCYCGTLRGPEGGEQR